MNSTDSIIKFMKSNNKNKITVIINDRQTFKMINIDDDEKILKTWDIFSDDIEKGFYPELIIRNSHDERYIINILFNSDNFKTELSFNRSEHIIRLLLNELIDNKIIYL